MIRKIVLAGGSGYIGTVLAQYFNAKAQEIVILSRQEAAASGSVRWVRWDGRQAGDWVQELEGADLLVNLCGKNVNCRYTPENRQAILRSRLEPTEALGLAISQLQDPPKCWIQFASATIYRHAEDRPQDEQEGEIGTGFSVDVCTAWEDVFWKQHAGKTRKIVLRVSLVLGRGDGVFPRLKNLVRAGLGGQQGHGRQMVSWIHEDDLARITEWCYEQGKDGAVYNATAPEPLMNHVLMKAFRKAYGIPVGLPAPKWLLEIGAALIGTETELILKSRWVVPRRLQEEGFRFQYARAEHAVDELMSRRL
jgi:uncharacterized protein